MSDRFEKTIDIRAPVERVWRALTDHVEFGTWFKASIDAPFKAGETATGTIDGGTLGVFALSMDIVAIEAPRRFVLAWHPYAIERGVDYSDEPKTTVEFVLEPVDGGTRVTVTESGFDALPAHRRDEAFRMNGRGWEIQLGNIQRHAEG